ncbi:MAG: ankyrin repeat domain-containing protein [Legionella longbeachae]|nr:ankyrin repeat domain-containing protein [Legionella longbeachae]
MQDKISKLPTVLLEKITKFLSIQELFRFIQVNKTIYEIFRKHPSLPIQSQLSDRLCDHVREKEDKLSPKRDIIIAKRDLIIEEMLRFRPELISLVHYDKSKNDPNKKFRFLSGWEEVLLKADINMATKMLMCLPKNEKGEKIKDELSEQYQNIKGKKEFVTFTLHDAFSLKEINQDLVKILLKGKVDVNSKTTEGSTPLQLICAREEEVPLDLVKMLIEHRADVNAEDKDGNTPLHIACDREWWQKKVDRQDLVKFLIENRADVNAKNGDGNTPLNIACYDNTDEKGLDVVKILITNKADVNTENESGSTPLIRASYNNYSFDNLDIIKFLLQSNAEVNVRNSDMSSSFMLFSTWSSTTEIMFDGLKTFFEYKADINMKDGTGYTPLLSFCSDSATSCETLQFLLDNKADVNSKTKYEDTVLHKILYKLKNKEDSYKTLIKFKLLLDNGARVLLDQPNNEGKTPLDLLDNLLEEKEKFQDFLEDMSLKKSVLNNSIVLFKPTQTSLTNKSTNSSLTSLNPN